MSEEPGTYQINSEPGVTSDAHAAIAEISGYYAIIPAELLYADNLPALVVYGVLDRIASRGNGYASIARLSQDTGMSAARVRRARNWLVDNGWVQILRHGDGRKATDYHLPFQSNKGRGVISDSPGVPKATSPTREINNSPKPKSDDSSTIVTESSWHQQVFKEIQEVRGYPSGNAAAEGKAIKAMLRVGYSAAEIVDCYKHLKTDHFWDSKALSLMTVATQIGEWKKNKGRPTTSPVRRTQERSDEDMKRSWGLIQ